MKKCFILLMLLSTCALKADDKNLSDVIDRIYEKINISSCLYDIESTFVQHQLHVSLLSTIFSHPVFVNTSKEVRRIFLTHYKKYIRSVQELMLEYPEESDSSSFHAYIHALNNFEKVSHFLDMYFLIHVAVGNFKDPNEQKKVCDICAEYLLKDRILFNESFYTDLKDTIDLILFHEKIGKIQSICQKSTDSYLAEEIYPLLKDIHTEEDLFAAFSAPYTDEDLNPFFKEERKPENAFETELLKIYQTFKLEVENLFNHLDVFFQEQLSDFDFLNFT